MNSVHAFSNAFTGATALNQALLNFSKEDRQLFGDKPGYNQEVNLYPGFDTMFDSNFGQYA